MNTSDEDNGRAKDLLLADLAYLGDAVRRNEEVGEKRFSFFVGRMTAVATGLIALSPTARFAYEIELRQIAGAAFGALFVIGLGAGVGALIIDGLGFLLAHERSDIPGAWQLASGSR